MKKISLEKVVLNMGIGKSGDVIELENVSDIYRLVPTEGKILKPIKINEAEKSKKLVRVVTKTSINKETTQTGFHDGRSTLAEVKAGVGDTCVMQIPDQKILDIIKLEAGCQGLVVRGINAGQIGKVESVEEGTFILPKRVILILGDKKIEIPADIIMPIGKEEPVIQLK